jgi:hypothetical protein
MSKLQAPFRRYVGFEAEVLDGQDRERGRFETSEKRDGRLERQRAFRLVPAVRAFLKRFLKASHASCFSALPTDDVTQFSLILSAVHVRFPKHYDYELRHLTVLVFL